MCALFYIEYDENTLLELYFYFYPHKTGTSFMNIKTVVFISFVLILLSSLIVTASDDNTIYLKSGNIDTDILDEQTRSKIAGIKTSSAPEPIEDSEKYYIVQFDGHVTLKWKDEIKNIGVEFFDYIPNNAYVLRMNATEKYQVESLEFVQWTGEYLPEYKYEFELADLEIQDTTVYLLVVLFESSNNELITEEITSIGGTILGSSDTILSISVSSDRINELAAIEGICWLEENSEPALFSDVAAGIINVNSVHDDIGLNGNGQIVAVCDTGLDTGTNDNSMHADIRGRILSIIDYNGDGAEDNGGHGTVVAGLVMGNGAMSGGQYSGMAPEASLVFEAIMDDNGNLNGINKENLNIIFQDAYEQEARIHTNSWGYTTGLGDYSSVSEQVDEFIWNNPDMLILFSVGNEATDSNKNGVMDKNSITPPATSKNALSVGASENYRPDKNSLYKLSVFPFNRDYVADNIEGIYATSGRGPTDDGRIKPDLVAPGTFIASTRSSIVADSLYNWGVINQYYAYEGGTSFATPLIAGAAALVREYYTDIERLESPSAALLKATLINGAYDMSPGQYGTGTYQEIEGRPDYSQGWGRVDVGNSVLAAYPEVIAYYDYVPLSDSQSWVHTYEYIENGQPAKATLVWTDYPSSLTSSKTLYNDLDLTLSGPSGTYYGNGKADHINNVEGIELDNVAEGDYTITVDGYNIQEGPQNFALVFSFTCDNNEYPASETYATNTTTAVSTDVVHPGGVKQDSIQMIIDGVAVTFTAQAINDGYTIQYNTPASYQSGEHNVSITAQTDSGQQFSYAWNFKVRPAITAFGFTDPVADGVVNEETKTIAITVPFGTEVTALTPTITYTGTSVAPASGTAQDFTEPVTYTVTAQDGSTQSYTVTVNVMASTQMSITAFGFTDPVADGVINEEAKTIAITVPSGTEVTALTPTITYTGTSVAPASGTAQDFTEPVTYTVTAEDGSTQEYITTVNVMPSADKSITAFRFAEPDVDGIIDENAKTITVTVPEGTNVTALVPTIIHTGVSIYPESGVVQNFTNPINYRVNAGDSTTQNYTISVKVQTQSTTSSASTSGGGGGGGGGGGTTGEEFENIELKDVSSIFVTKDMSVKFEFQKEGNDIQYVGYESLKNAGTISTTIEVLKEKSTFVDTLPSGEVYKNINIWVGKVGYATESNIVDPVIGFKVARDWIEDSGIIEDTIVLNRYDGDWSGLTTVQTGSDEDYLYFEAYTSGFSSFVITGEKKLFSVPDEQYSTIDESESGVNISTESETQEENTLATLSALMSILIISFVCFLVRKH